jgi:hypothetical protein
MTSRGWRKLLNDIFRGRLPERNATAMEVNGILAWMIWAWRSACTGGISVGGGGGSTSEANDKRYIYVRCWTKATPLEGQPFVSRTAACVERTEAPVRPALGSTPCS